MLCWGIVLALLVFDSHVLVDEVEAIELNHLFSVRCELVLDQAILWGFHPETGELAVRNWLKINDARLILEGDDLVEDKKAWHDRQIRDIVDRIAQKQAFYYKLMNQPFDQEAFVRSFKYGGDVPPYTPKLLRSQFDKIYRWHDGTKCIIVVDTRDAVIRVVKFQDQVYHTWTTKDPELMNRNVVDEQDRHHMSKFGGQLRWSGILF